MRVWQIAELLGVSADYLGEHGSTSPRLDAELLLAEVLGLGRVDLYTQYDRPLSAAEVDRYRELIARRAGHEPVAYILGRVSFRYLTLEVAPAVLIPRPETEELVGAVLAWLGERPVPPVRYVVNTGAVAPSAAVEGGPAPPPPLIADVGTGSGAIALALAAEAHVRVVGIDSSEAALAVAGENRRALGLEELVELRVGDLLAGVAPGGLRVVVSNPPYVSVSEYEGLAPDVREFEPPGALVAGDDGLAVFRRLVPQAHAALGPGGALFVEVGDTQAAAVCDLAARAGFALVDVVRDLSAKERIVRVVKGGAPVLGDSELGGADGDVFLADLRGALERGGVIGVPTDTVYGLGAAWTSAAGVRRLFEAKGRGEAKPVAALFSSVVAVNEALPDLHPSAVRVLEALLPGPYTFVVATNVPRPPLVGTDDSLGVRVPAQPRLLDLLAGLGVPLAVTSANRSGGPDVARPEEVDERVLAHGVAALTLGESPAGSPSTVVDLRPLVSGDRPIVLREGVVSTDAALAAVGAVQ